MFIVVANVFEWCINHESVEHLFHYLDDLAVLGPPNVTECDEEVQTIQKTATELEISLAADKQDKLTIESFSEYYYRYRSSRIVTKL